jgi:hypothetical protein
MILRHLLLASCSALLTGPSRAFALNATLDSIDDLPEDIQKEYVQGADGKFTLQVTGLKPEGDVTRLQNALNKERQDHAALKQRIKDNFGDEKFEDIHQKLDRIPELELAAEGKMDEEKLNGIVEGRLRTKIAPLEREITTLKGQLTEKDGTIGELTTKERKRTIADAVREAATKAKVTPEALDDALMLGDAVLEVREDDGKVVVKDNVGYTPGIEPSVLFTDLQSKKPHWFGVSAGGGAGGNRGGGGVAKNPFTVDNWNVTEQGQLINSDAPKADQLARQAGHADALSARKPAPAPATR